MRGHAQVQRPQPAVDEEAVERPGHRADRVLDEADLLVQLPGRARSRRRRRCRSARRGTSWSSARRRRRRARAGAGGPGSRTCCRPTTSALRLRSITPARSITLSDGLVGVSTQTSAVSARTARRDRVEVALVDHVVLEAEAREHLVDEPVGAAVEVVGEDDVRAGARDRGDQRVLGGHAGGERAARARPRARRARLERRARRVGRARVVEVADELAGRGLHVGRGLVDRRDDRAVGRVGREPRVDAAGGELGHVTSDSSRSARVTMPSGRPCSVTVSAWRSPASSSTASRTESVDRDRRERLLHHLGDLEVHQRRRPRSRA